MKKDKNECLTHLPSLYEECSLLPFPKTVVPIYIHIFHSVWSSYHVMLIVLHWEMRSLLPSTGSGLPSNSQDQWNTREVTLRLPQLDHKWQDDIYCPFSTSRIACCGASQPHAVRTLKQHERECHMEKNRLLTNSWYQRASYVRTWEVNPLALVKPLGDCIPS